MVLPCHLFGTFFGALVAIGSHVGMLKGCAPPRHARAFYVMTSCRSRQLDRHALELALARMLPISQSSQMASYIHLNLLILHNDLTIALLVCACQCCLGLAAYGLQRIAQLSDHTHTLCHPPQHLCLDSKYYKHTCTCIDCSLRKKSRLNKYKKQLKNCKSKQGQQDEKVHKQESVGIRCIPTRFFVKTLLLENRLQLSVIPTDSCLCTFSSYHYSCNFQLLFILVYKQGWPGHSRGLHLCQTVLSSQCFSSRFHTHHVHLISTFVFMLVVIIQSFNDWRCD